MRWFPYVALGIAALANLLVFTTGTWPGRWVNLAVALLMVWAGWRFHRNRRILDEMERELRARFRR